MQGLSWKWVAVLGLVIAGAVTAAVLGRTELAGLLGAAAAGLLGPARKRGPSPTAKRRDAVAGGGLLLWAVLAVGCGGAAQQVETARVGACQAAEQRIENRVEAGELSYERARERIQCTRHVCDEMHRRLTHGE